MAALSQTSTFRLPTHFVFSGLIHHVRIPRSSIRSCSSQSDSPSQRTHILAPRHRSSSSSRSSNIFRLNNTRVFRLCSFIRRYVVDKTLRCFVKRGAEFFSLPSSRLASDLASKLQTEIDFEKEAAKETPSVPEFLQEFRKAGVWEVRHAFLRCRGAG